MAASVDASGVVGPLLVDRNTLPFSTTQNSNSHDQHLSVEVARSCIDHLESVVNGCLCLTQYKTASIDALRLLAGCNFSGAEFGLAELTDDVARTLREVAIPWVSHYHVERTSLNALATLLSAPGHTTWFDNVVSLCSDGIASLDAALTPLRSNPEGEPHTLILNGDFQIDGPIARALINMRSPLSIDLIPERKQSAVTVDAWLYLTNPSSKALRIMTIGGALRIELEHMAWIEEVGS